MKLYVVAINNSRNLFVINGEITRTGFKPLFTARVTPIIDIICPICREIKPLYSGQFTFKTQGELFEKIHATCPFCKTKMLKVSNGKLIGNYPPIHKLISIEMGVDID